MCRSEQATNNVLAQRFIMRKGSIKYTKANGITPMITHVQVAHPKLFASRNNNLMYWQNPLLLLFDNWARKG